MTTKAELENALKDAMRASDDLRKRTLRMAIAAIKFAEIEKRAALDEPAIAAILQKEIKMRREAIADAQKANRPDLAAAAEDEIGALEQYLPKGLTPEELDALVRQVIGEVGATSPKDMGQVMKALMPRLQGRAPGDQVNQAVRRLLQG